MSPRKHGLPGGGWAVVVAAAVGVGLFALRVRDAGLSAVVTAVGLAFILLGVGAALGYSAANRRLLAMFGAESGWRARLMLPPRFMLAYQFTAGAPDNPANPDSVTFGVVPLGATGFGTAAWEVTAHAVPWPRRDGDVEFVKLRVDSTAFRGFAEAAPVYQALAGDPPRTLGDLMLVLDRFGAADLDQREAVR